MDRFDVIVIGGGIAGASVAAELAPSHRVLLLEAEAQPGYHSTGRSAALFTQMYGNATVRGLSSASRSMLFDPPADFVTTPLVRGRGVLFIARESQLEALDDLQALPGVRETTRRLSRSEMLALCPVLRSDYVQAGIHEPDACDVDVHGLQQGYLRRLRRHGGALATSTRVIALQRAAGRWHVITEKGDFFATVVVNAAGAWADEVATLAGVRPIGLRPCRRTAVLVNAPDGMPIDAWPLVLDVDEQFYFKPDAGLVLISPADETPVAPADVQPEEWDIAVGIDRVSTATTLDIRHVKHKWAGLRSFVADRTPVAGFDADVPGFFWLAAQGGYGVQTAPAMAQAAAALVRNEDIPESIASYGVSADALAPYRPGLRGPQSVAA
jgi:D-arginine dehydrogenase